MRLGEVKPLVQDHTARHLRAEIQDSTAEAANVFPKWTRERKYFGLCGPISVTTTQLCYSITKATTDNM